MNSSCAIAKVVLITFFLVGCRTGSDTVDSFFQFSEDLVGDTIEVPVLVPTELSVLIASPDAGTIVGYQTTLSGTCNPVGKSIEISGEGVSGFAVCGIGGTWEADVDFTAAAVGSVTLVAKMVDGDDESGESTLSVTKDNSDCDSSTNRSATYAGGDGAGSPYIICTTIQFDNMRLADSSNFALKNDIDFGGAPITPMPTTFSGSLDGNGFEIKNVLVNTPTSSDTGIFSYLRDGASISNLILRDITVSGNQRPGGLVGRVTGVAGATLSNITVIDASVSSAGTGAGGVVGYIDNGSQLAMSDITVTNVSVTAPGQAGGILGYTHSSAVSFSLTNATVSGSLSVGGNYAGGVAGFLDLPSSTIDQVASTVSINSSGSYVSGVVGRMDGGDLSNASYRGSLIGSGSDYIGGIAGDLIADDFFNNQSAAEIFCDSSTITCQYIGGLVGRSNSDTLDVRDCLSEVDVTVIGDIASNYVGGAFGFFRGANLQDCEARGSSAGLAGTLTVDSGDGSTTGGHSYGGFAGRIYVNDSISTTIQDSTANVDISVLSATQNVYTGGFVGYIYTAEPTGGPAILTMSNLDSYGDVESSNRYVGGFAGGTYAGRFGSTINGNNLRALGETVEATQYGAASSVAYVGGFSGASTTRNSGGEANAVSGGHQLTSISSTSNVSAEGSNVGGLIGYFYGGRNGASGSSSTLQDASATGTVEATYENAATSYVGGLIGRVYAEPNVSITIDSSAPGLTFATGSVEGEYQYIGGLIGDAAGGSGAVITIDQVRASGSVTMTSDSSLADGFVGGLIGRAGSDGVTLSNCSATGDVNYVITSTGSATRAYTGGLVGYAVGTIDVCYATGDVNVTSSATAGNRQYVGGLAGRGNSLISNSFATGNVVGGYATGGLVGYQRNGITNSFAAGNVTGAIDVGGLVGDYNAGAAGEINNVYAIGSVTREAISAFTNRFGQLVGRCGNDSYLTNGYYNSDSSLVDSAVSSPEANCNTSTARDLDSAEMQDDSQYGGSWDFSGSSDDSWRFSNASRSWWGGVYPYPLLYWYTAL